jgi:hypothetical protein
LIVRQPKIEPNDGGEASWGVPIVPPAGSSIESVAVTAASCAAPPSYGNVFVNLWPAVNCSDDVRTFPANEYFEGFSISLGCVDYFTVEGTQCPAGPWVAAHFFATTVVDPEPPKLSGLEGSMLDPGVRRGRQSIGIEADDLGGGLTNLSLNANGLPAAQPKTLNCNLAQAKNRSVTGTVAASISPCPPKAKAQWVIDTGAYPFHDGANTVQVCASDFATLGDPNTTCLPARSVDIDNSCSPSQVDGGQVLSAQFSGSNAEEITVGYGKGAQVIGRLANGAGDPVANATVCVKSQILEVDPRPFPVATVKTNAAGQYSYDVPPGPNREIVVGYRHDAVQVARDVRFYAHAQPSLHASPKELENGKRVHFWGQLPGPNGDGRVVVMQANVVGSKRWITFRKATTDRKAVFKAAYHFTATTHTTRYRFRAIVPAQTGYPWVQGHSKPVKVLVHK